MEGADLAALEILRTGKGMQLLADLGRGRALGSSARKAFANAGGAVVIGTRDLSPSSLVYAGRGLLRLWLAATRAGLGLHPWGSPFLLQRLLEASETLDAWERRNLEVAVAPFRAAVPVASGVTPLMVLRLSNGPRAKARSIRRDVDEVLSVRSG
jgi:hypothetical protein